MPSGAALVTAGPDEVQLAVRQPSICIGPPARAHVSLAANQRISLMSSFMLGCPQTMLSHLVHI